ncbi:MAG: VirB4 family type IV secretion system protein [Candidatus Dormibacteria bacterium]
MWRVVGPDLLDLAETERLRLAQQFADWLGLLAGAVTVVICSRRMPDGAAAGSGPALEQGRFHGPPTEPIHPGAYSRNTYFVTDCMEDATAVDLLAALGRSCQVEIAGAERLPRLADGPVREQVRRLRIGGHWLGSLRLARLPGGPVHAGWLWSLAGTPGEYDLAVSIAPRAEAAADRALRRRLRSLRALELAGSAYAPDPRISRRARAAQGFREVLAEGQETLFEIAMTISFAADSQPQLDALIRDFQTRAGAVRSRWVPAWFDELPARLESLARPTPGRGPRLLVSTSELTTLWPWFGPPEPEPASRSLVGTHQRTGSRVSLDLHGDPDLPNANLAVVAASGAGKSYLAGLLGLEAVRRGHSVVVIDPENEHSNWCRHAGGSYLDLGQSPSICLNVLELGSATEALAAAVDLVSVLCGPLEAAERSVLMEAVGGLIGNGCPDRPPVLGDCVPLLEKHEAGRSLASRLHPWVTGDAGQLFSRPGRGPAVAGVLAIGMRSLPEPWIRAAALLVSSWLWHWVKSHPGPKQIIVDEAGLLAEHPALQLLMERLARRVRKYQGSLMLLTQTGADLTETHFGEVMAVNSATQLLGIQSESGARRLQRSLALDDHDRLFIQRAGRGSFLLVCGKRRVPVTVAAPPLYHRWLTGGPSGALAPRQGWTDGGPGDFPD